MSVELVIYIISVPF